jgi:hypothetical protein
VQNTGCRSTDTILIVVQSLDEASDNFLDPRTDVLPDSGLLLIVS